MWSFTPPAQKKHKREMLLDIIWFVCDEATWYNTLEQLWTLTMQDFVKLFLVLIYLC